MQREAKVGRAERALLCHRWAALQVVQEMLMSQMPPPKDSELCFEAPTYATLATRGLWPVSEI